MKKGERAFFYHSGETKDIVGVVEIIREAYSDKTAEEGNWVCVDVKAIAPFPQPVTLAEVKKSPAFKDMALVKYGRLSVQPVTDKEWAAICKLGKFAP